MRKLLALVLVLAAARAARAQDATAESRDVAPATSSGVVGLTVEGDKDIFDEVRLGGMARAGVLAQRRTGSRSDEVNVAAPTRAQLSLDAILREDVTVRTSVAWNGTIDAAPEWRPHTGKEEKIVLEELFVEARSLGGTPLWARVGRQPLARGTGMLLGEDLEGSRKTHDAALLAWETPTVVLHVYWERLARHGLPGIDAGAFTGDIDSGGAYVTKRFRDELGVDVYGIHVHDRGRRDPAEDRTTAGARVFGRVADLVDYSVEGAAQVGFRASDAGRQKIQAYAAEGELSLDLRRAPFAPRLTLHGALASGDKDPGDRRATTFDPLYEDDRARFGISNLVSLENLRAGGARIGARPTDSLLLEVSFHALWVDEPADAAAPHFFATRGRPSRSRELGDDISARVRLDPRDELSIEAGGSVFVPGAYARAKLEGASVLGSGYVLVEVRF